MMTSAVTAGATDTAAAVAAGKAAAPGEHGGGGIDLGGQGLRAHGFLELVLPGSRLQLGIATWKMALGERKSWRIPLLGINHQEPDVLLNANVIARAGRSGRGLHGRSAVASKGGATP